MKNKTGFFPTDTPISSKLKETVNLSNAKFYLIKKNWKDEDIRQFLGEKLNFLDGKFLKDQGRIRRLQNEELPFHFTVDNPDKIQEDSRVAGKGSNSTETLILFIGVEKEVFYQRLQKGELNNSVIGAITLQNLLASRNTDGNLPERGKKFRQHFVENPTFKFASKYEQEEVKGLRRKLAHGANHAAIPE